MNDAEMTKQAVKDKYGKIAVKVKAGTLGSCCGTGSCDVISSDLYPSSDTSSLPGNALAASLGCGNPTALAVLHPGDVVLDLGSGGGIDVLLSAKRVGPQGKVYGLDMTDDMLELARENQRKAGATNVEFLKGEIEHIPLPDGAVDLIISNCVINLSSEKEQVLKEAFRVLSPGGRFAVSDIVGKGALPPQVQKSLDLWSGCVAGAIQEPEYREMLQRVGFVEIDIEPTRVYHAEDARGWMGEAGLDAAALAPLVDGKLMSAFIRARKPA